MKLCEKCGRQYHEENGSCPFCAAQGMSNDTVSIGLCILSALFPIVGVVYWALKYKETPKRARACGITAIVSWVVSFLVGFVVGFIGGLAGAL